MRSVLSLLCFALLLGGCLEPEPKEKPLPGPAESQPAPEAKAAPEELSARDHELLSVAKDAVIEREGWVSVVCEARKKKGYLEVIVSRSDDPDRNQRVLVQVAEDGKVIAYRFVY